jgi:DNA-binding MarR family transcriptional regulator
VPGADHNEPDVRTAYRLEDQIGFFLRRASQRHAAIFATRMIAELTPMQWAALVKISECQPVSQNHLGREAAMDAATIKGVVDRLLKRGFVTTRPDPEDGRRTLIALTPRGADLMAAAIPAARAITAETVEPLSPGERQLLLELLAKIA